MSQSVRTWNIHLGLRDFNCKTMQAKFPKLNSNFGETEPFTKVFNSGLFSWRPIKSDKGSMLSRIPHLPGWISAYSTPASWSPSEERTASQEAPLPLCKHSLHSNSSTTSHIFTKHILCLSTFAPSKNRQILSPLLQIKSDFTGEDDWVLLLTLRKKPKKIMLNFKCYQSIFFIIIVIHT